MNQKLSIWDYFEKCVTQNYANFEGRAKRKEFWSYVLVIFLLSMALNVISYMLVAMTDMLAFAFIPTLLAIALFLPGLAVCVRRLHDVGRSGLWYLMILIPLIGAFILLYWFIKDGDLGPNEYGEDPKQLT